MFFLRVNYLFHLFIDLRGVITVTMNWLFGCRSRHRDLVSLSLFDPLFNSLKPHRAVRLFPARDMFSI